MRIHVIATSLDAVTGGGSHRNCIAIIRALRDAGHAVSVHVLFSLHNSFPGDIVPETYAAEKLGFRAFIAFVSGLLQKNESAADVYLLYGQALIFGAGRYRRSGGTTPVAVYLDNYLDSMGLAHRDVIGAFGRLRESLYRAKRFLYDASAGLGDARVVDRYLAVSPFVRDAYVRFGFPAERFAVVPNFFDAVPEAARARVPGASVRFLYVGRLTYDKGVDILLAALALLPDAPAWTAHIVGDGRIKNELLARSRALRLSDRVSFVPWMSSEALESEYASADILVHPARWPEPFGRTIVEAMQRGVVPVVPARGGAVWAAGDAAATFRSGRAASLAAVLRELMADASRLAALRAKGISRAAAFGKATVLPSLLSELTLISKPSGESIRS